MGAELGYGEAGGALDRVQLAGGPGEARCRPGLATQPAGAGGGGIVRHSRHPLQPLRQVQRRQPYQRGAGGETGRRPAGPLLGQIVERLVHHLLGGRPPGGQLAAGHRQQAVLLPDRLLARGLRRVVGVAVEDRSQAGEGAHHVAVDDLVVREVGRQGADEVVDLAARRPRVAQRAVVVDVGGAGEHSLGVGHDEHRPAVVGRRQGHCCGHRQPIGRQHDVSAS